MFFDKEEFEKTLQFLLKHGYIERLPDGRFKITEKGREYLTFVLKTDKEVQWKHSMMLFFDYILDVIFKGRKPSYEDLEKISDYHKREFGFDPMEWWMRDIDIRELICRLKKEKEDVSYL